MNKTLVTILVLIGISAVGFLSWQYVAKQASIRAIANFEECAKAGYPIMESYPAQCRTPDDRTFTQIIPKEITMPPTQMETVINFEQCAQAGGQIMESYPRQCRSQEGKFFNE